jgi:CRISPR-associated protein Csd1
MELVERCAAETQEPDVWAVLSFLRNDPPGRVNTDESFDPSGIITFRVEGKFTIDIPGVQEFWASVNAADAADSQMMQCLVCGIDRPVLDRLQAKIKGIPGGQTAGMSIISANADAFESYGLRASLIAPTCSSCGEKFTRGINALLSSEQSRVNSGGGVFVFWTREESGFNFSSALNDPGPGQVQALLETVRRGRWTDLDDGPFYALSLSASGGRVVVRDWLDTTVGNAKRYLAGWFEGQRIASWSEDEGRYYGLRALALATVREIRDLPVTTPRALVRAAFTGNPVPWGILYQAVRRNRAEQGVNRSRAALIKLVLLSQNTDYQEGYMVQLDVGNTNPAYLCGRLLAVLEQAQREAMPKVNTTIVDRFYGTASTAPQSVFSRLLKGARAHLSKLERDKKGAYLAIEARLEEILSQLDAKDNFPKTLTLEQQGLFSLGYYHQRAHNRAQGREAAERRRNRQGAGEGAAPENE